jgi:signal transduction histidine kinase
VTVRRRLVTSTALIALAAILVLGFPLAVVESARVRSDQTGRLEREADAVAAVVDDRVERGDPVTAAQIAPRVVSGHEISVLMQDGRRLLVGARLGRDARRVKAGSSRNAVVTAAAPLGEEHRREQRAIVLLIALSTGGLALAVVLARFQARRLSEPLESVARSSARLGDGDFSVRAPRSGVPEIDAIAQALDTSARRIAGLVGREREFSSNVSHQLRTPLTALRLRIEELTLVADPAERERETAAALREADRLEATIGDLLAHARTERLSRVARVDLSAIARDHVAGWRAVVEQAGRSLRLEAYAPVNAEVSPGTVGQVLDVLVENALRHGAGAITVRVGTDGGRQVVSVEDDGPGLPADAREEAFRRGASGGGGTGIGLHLARALADADGATLRVAPDRPSRFVLRFATKPSL